VKENKKRALVYRAKQQRAASRPPNGKSQGPSINDDLEQELYTEAEPPVAKAASKRTSAQVQDLTNRSSTRTEKGAGKRQLRDSSGRNSRVLHPAIVAAGGVTKKLSAASTVELLQRANHSPSESKGGARKLEKVQALKLQMKQASEPRSYAENAEQTYTKQMQLVIQALQLNQKYQSYEYQQEQRLRALAQAERREQASVG